MAAALVLTALRLRAWGLRWGATEEDLLRVMPGDDWVSHPGYVTTRAVVLRAEPGHVWPWLVQMGRGRGGLYSIDWLDRLFNILDAPSAEDILPAYQHLQAGDVIPIGRNGGFPVLAIEPGRVLALAGDDGGVRWSWVFGLYSQPDGTTRLVSRNRASVSGLQGRIALLLVDLPAFIMTRQMLINLKRRAERLAGARDR